MTEYNITPEAAELAELYEIIDPLSIKGTGAEGRILKSDVEAYIEEHGLEAPEYEYYGIFHDNELEPVVVREGEGNPIWLAFSLYETKYNEDSLSVFKMTSPANTELAPSHVHPFDEFLLVTKGTVQSFVGEEQITHTLHAGDMIYLPAGILEGFRTLHEPAEMYWFMVMDQGSSEDFFIENGVPAQFRRTPPAGYYTPPTFEETKERAEGVGFAGVPRLTEESE